ncbi:MAG: hypothetical protein KAS32_29980 [Candidatus Peribacteraceae bacterium]|nr:hypothetical protein [Candidatus Peribacteraceae bacterium]
MYNRRFTKKHKKRASKWKDHFQREQEKRERRMKGKGIITVDPQQRKLMDSQKRNYEMMNNIRVKRPISCSNEEIISFYNLVIEGGEVSSDGLLNRIKKSYLLGFYTIDNELVGVAALKHPSPSYKRRVFSKAGEISKVNQFNLEMGYAVTKQGYEGRHICRKLVRALIINSKSKKIYATIHNKRMKYIVKLIGFQKFGNEYIGQSKRTLELFTLE